ncbi:unnamed protein product [Schistosoma intercalatum]|nr:unnamed protein product [Schistosoma intercalatum]CAH8512791.1 unnamed protein product [Schistosoma intercalatum]
MKSLCILCLLISLVFCMDNVMEDSTQQLQVQKDLRRRSQPNLYQCMACVSGVEQAKNIIISSSANVSISGIITNVCMGTGPFNTSCGMFVNGLLSNIFYIIQEVIPYDLCATLDFCDHPPEISVCEYCLKSGLSIKSILLSETFVSELYNNTLNMCNTQRNQSLICGPFLHDLFLAVTLSFNKQFLIQRLCQNAGFCSKV